MLAQIVKHLLPAVGQQSRLGLVLGVVVPVETGLLHVIFGLVVVIGQPKTVSGGHSRRKLLLLDRVEARWRVVLRKLRVDIVSGFACVIVTLFLCNFVILFDLGLVAGPSFILQRVRCLHLRFRVLLEGVLGVGARERQEIVGVNNLPSLLHYSI